MLSRSYKTLLLYFYVNVFVLKTRCECIDVDYLDEKNKGSNNSGFPNDSTNCSFVGLDGKQVQLFPGCETSTDSEVCTIYVDTPIVVDGRYLKKPLYLNLVNKKTRLPLMSATYLDRHNLGEQLKRSDNWQPKEFDPNFDENHQPYCKSFYPIGQAYKKDDFINRKGRERGHLTPAFGNQFTLTSSEDTSICINVAPQDSYVNNPVWSTIEMDAYNQMQASCGGYIVTGTSIETWPITRGSAAAPGMLEKPKFFWKIVCTRPDNDSGLPRVQGWVAANHNPVLQSKPNSEQKCNQIKQEAWTRRSLDDVLELSGYTRDQLRTVLFGLDRKLPPSAQFSNVCFGPSESLLDIYGGKGGPLPPDPKCDDDTYDSTLVPFARGQKVSIAAIQKVQDSQLMEGTHNLFRSTALIVSAFAVLAAALFFWPGTAAGIGVFTITSEILLATKFFALSKEEEDLILENFGINWQLVEHVDMLKPLHNTIAAALWYKINAHRYKPPRTFAITAEIIKDLFIPSSRLDMNQSHIEHTLREFYNNQHTRGVFDLLAVLDGSGSIGATEFHKAKQVISNLLTTTKTQSPLAKFGLILFSTDSETIFDFNDDHSAIEIERLVMNLPYPNGGTNTGKAVLDAIQMFSNTGHPITPYVCVVVTDGKSNDFKATSEAAERMNGMGVTTFAIGVGGSAFEEELHVLAGGEEHNVFLADSYDELIELPFWLNHQFYDRPRTVPFNQSTEDQVAFDETRFFQFDIPDEGLTIRIDDVAGETERHYSFTFQNPTSAMYEGIIRQGFHQFKKNSTVAKQSSAVLYLSVTGLMDDNVFRIIAHEKIIEGCGFKRYEADFVDGQSLARRTEGETLIWESEVYGYEDSARWVDNSQYVRQERDGQFLQFITKPTFPSYVDDTGEWTINITALFMCPGGSTKRQTISFPIVA